jgi:hypothetical protein
MTEQLTPAAQEIVPALRQKNRIERRSRPLTAMIVTAAVLVVSAFIYLVAHQAATDEVTDRLATQGQARDQQISGIQDQLKGVCKKVANPSSLTPQEREGCYRAENSIPPAPVVVTQVPAAGLSAAQVQAMINASLAQVPRPLTVEQVTAAAQLVFAQNAASLSPSPEKLAQAVSGFCAQDACRGPQGTKGDPAPAITNEQIYSQVSAYCAANSGCVGPPGAAGKNGDRGPQGISVQAFSDPGPRRDRPGLTDPPDTAPCTVTVTLIDPETMQHSTEAFNVPVEFCWN